MKQILLFLPFLSDIDLSLKISIKNISGSLLVRRGKMSRLVLTHFNFKIGGGSANELKRSM